MPLLDSNGTNQYLPASSSLSQGFHLHFHEECPFLLTRYKKSHVAISASSGFPTVKASFRNSCQHTTQEVAIQEPFSQPTTGTKEWVCPLLASTIKNWLVTFSRTPSITGTCTILSWKILLGKTLFCVSTQNLIANWMELDLHCWPKIPWWEI